MPDPFFHLKTELVGNSIERTNQRAEAFAVALMHAATDPGFRAAMGSPEMPETPFRRMKLALGRAYSEATAGEPRGEVLRRLRDLLDETPLMTAAQDHLPALADIVRARSIGDRCGDHISKIQLGLLSEALALPSSQPVALPAPESHDG